MINENMIIPDDGFHFGLGVFETIAIENSKPVLLSEHLERMENSLSKIGVSNSNFKSSVTLENINSYVNQNNLFRSALKITVTESNILFSHRSNPYSSDDYRKGFITDTSEVLRNETSIFTYIKSLNYGDNIIEKRRAKERMVDEPIFLNSNGMVCEGATTNVFFIKEGRIFTPLTECGLLEGIMRKHIIETNDVTLTFIPHESISSYDEMFLTNSLMGIMPVKKFRDHIFKENTFSIKLIKEYDDFIKSL